MTPEAQADYTQHFLMLFFLLKFGALGWWIADRKVKKRRQEDNDFIARGKNSGNSI